MKNKIKILLIVFFIIIVTVVAFILSSNNTDNNDTSTSEIYSYTLDNSNVDIIKTSGFVILINTGYLEDSLILFDYLDELEITKINYLILANYNDEYIENASYIIKNYNVDYVYVNDYEYETDSYNTLNNTLSDSYTEKIVLTSTEEITIDDLIINIYSYMGDTDVMEDKTFVVSVKNDSKKICLYYDASSKRYSDIDDCYITESYNDDIKNIDSSYYLYDGSNLDNEEFLKRNKVFSFLEDDIKISDLS